MGLAASFDARASACLAARFLAMRAAFFDARSFRLSAARFAFLPVTGRAGSTGVLAGGWTDAAFATAGAAFGTAATGDVAAFAATTCGDAVFVTDGAVATGDDAVFVTDGAVATGDDAGFARDGAAGAFAVAVGTTDDGGRGAGGVDGRTVAGPGTLDGRGGVAPTEIIGAFATEAPADGDDGKGDGVFGCDGSGGGFAAASGGFGDGGSGGDGARGATGGAARGAATGVAGGDAPTPPRSIVPSGRAAGGVDGGAGGALDGVGTRAGGSPTSKMLEARCAGDSGFFGGRSPSSQPESRSSSAPAGFSVSLMNARGRYLPRVFPESTPGSALERHPQALFV
jgi:hypothetical protein